MIEQMSKSSENVLGFRVSGDVSKDDYSTLDSAVGSAVDAYGSVDLLFDMTEFHWEKAEAWASDVDFGKKYEGSIDRMAIVGDQKWEKYLAKLSQSFYAKKSLFFQTVDDAWEWLKS